MTNIYSNQLFNFKEFNIDDICINNDNYTYIIYDPSLNLEGRYLQNGDTYIRRFKDAFRYGLKDRNDLVIKNLIVLENTLSFDLYIYKELMGHYNIQAHLDEIETIMIILSIYYLEGKELRI